MDPSERQRLVERVWLLEQLRAEAKARARAATIDARQALQRAEATRTEAAELHGRVADIGDQIADLHDQLGEPDEAGEARSDADSERRAATGEVERGD